MSENIFANANSPASVSSTINFWKSKLLDLTKRNRALNFKVQKVSTVTVVDEQPSEIFKLLCLQNKSLKFLPDPNARPIKSKEESIASKSLLLDAERSAIEESFELDLPAPDFVPYDAQSLAERYTDDFLQTTAAPEDLDKSLRRLEEQARAALEEQGVNELFLTLGTLHYRESVDSKEVYKAPLILVPVELSRKSARTGFIIKQTEDEAIVNPSLIEFMRQHFSVIFPEIADSGSLDADYDLQQFLSSVAQAVSRQKDWAVKNEIFLALFLFQKLVMYKDLEKNADNLAAHKIVKSIITKSSQHFIGLPPEIREMQLDRDFAPEATAQVVNADSSQLRAVAAIARNYDLVLEGPPGTGKSQTITNLVAQTLAAGKTVLFVAEKMAALEVVYRRLAAVGLGEFCLELHSTKANKRAVMQEIRAALDASLQSIAVPQHSTERLPVVRQQLTNYTNAVHMPYGSLNLSPYCAFGELGKVLNAPKFALQTDIFNITPAPLDEALRELRDLHKASQAVGIPAQHAWRNTSKTFYAESDLDRIAALGTELKQKLEKLIVLAETVENDFGLLPVENFADVETVVEVAAVLSRSPGAPIAVLGNAAWNDAPPEARSLLEKGRKIVAEHEKLLQKFMPATLTQNHADDIAFIERKSEGIFSFLAFLDYRFRATKKRWRGFRQDGYEASLIEQANDLKAISELQCKQRELEAQATLGSQLFGSLWEGEASNWQALEKYIAWVLDFRRLCVSHSLQEQALTTASRPAPDVSKIQQLLREAGQIQAQLKQFCPLVGWTETYFDKSDLSMMLTRIAELTQNLNLAPRWAAFEMARQKVGNGIVAELLPAAMNGELAFADLERIFSRAFYQKWLSRVVQERPQLLHFQTLTHEQRVAEFQELDERVLSENRAALVGAMRERVQYNLQKPELRDAMSFLRKQLARQKGLAPLRVTMKQAFSAVRMIKPCFMMSPQTVAQLLDNAETKFDLVIFDEASQLPTEEAVGAVLRGNQLVVVGDPKQLPPTNFFAVNSGTVNAPIGEDGLPLYEDSQSILEEVAGAGVPNCRLKWHYRSAHESLITFSNVQFYDSDLYTFPSVETDNYNTGLHFEFVENGIYEGKGLNLIEARRVADAVVEHAKTKPDETLGVGTFNQRQQIAILDELEIRRRNDPTIESFFDRSRFEPFFVKNLENIQGDERDAIFLSVTYAKASDGRLRYNFGPLNGENGWRRLNVLTTRARRLMRVYSSIRGEDINPASTTSRGAQLLRDFLIYAEHKRLDSSALSALADTESPFERDVFQELTNRGVKLVSQVGVCGYRIDFGVLDEEVEGRFICAIECDGASYHSSETARDRDRLRQQVLEGRGWEVHRVWSTDWFKDRAGQIERILGLIEASLCRAKTKQAGEREQQNSAELEQAKQIQEFLGDGGENEINNLFDNTAHKGYVRPKAENYRFATFQNFVPPQGLLEMPTNQLANIILHIVNIESPIHLEDLAKRTTSAWGQKTGSRMSNRVIEVVQLLSQANRVDLRGEFVWKPDGVLEIRSRNGTSIPAERIAPEEIQAVIVAALEGANGGFMRQELINEVRDVFGFNRTGAALQQTIDNSIEELLSEGIIGEGSLGVALRK